MWQLTVGKGHTMYLIKNNRIDTEIHQGQEWLMFAYFALKKSAIKKDAPVIYTAGEKAAQRQRSYDKKTISQDTIQTMERGLIGNIQSWRSNHIGIETAVWTEIDHVIGQEDIHKTVWELNGKYLYNAEYLGWLLHRLGWGVEDLIAQGRIAIDETLLDWHALLLFDAAGIEVVGVLPGLRAPVA